MLFVRYQTKNKNQNKISVPKTHYNNLILVSQRYAMAGLRYVGLGGLVLLTLSLSQPVQASELIGGEARIIQLTNQIRTVRGIPVLSQNAFLDQSAQAKAEDMANSGYFGHADEHGNRMAYWIKSVGYDYLRAGENLGKGFSSVEAVMQAWTNSPTHYANLVNDNYSEIGVGVANGIIDGKATIFVVQHFGQPMPKLTIPTLTVINVLGDTITNTDVESNVVSPGTGGSANPYSPPARPDSAKRARGGSIFSERINDNAIVNATPKGLLFIAYGTLADTTTAIAQTWSDWQGDLPSVPYASDLPRAGYQLVQILVMLGWFAGGAWLIYRSVAPVLTWLKQRPKFVIKLPLD